MTYDPNICRKPGCDQPIAYQGSYAAAARPLHCDEHTSENLGGAA